MSEKDFEFVPSRRNGIITFNLGNLLLSAKFDFIAEEHSRKRYVLKIYYTGHVKMIFTLSTKMIAFHMGIFLIQIRVPSFKASISKDKVCLIMFLALNKKFWS